MKVMDFDGLKKRSSDDYLDFLRGHLRFDIGRHKRKKLQVALGSLWNETLLDKYISERHAKRLEQQFFARWGMLKRNEALDRLRFWTVLDSLCYLNPDLIVSHVEKMKDKLIEVCEGIRGIEVIGVCEIEIVNFDKMGFLAEDEDEARKLKTLTAMIPDGKGTLFEGQLSSYALVHFHGIVDLKRFSLKKQEELQVAADAIWSDNYNAQLQKLYDTQSMNKTFSTISKYLVKGGNENLMYKIGYGYDNEDAMNRHMIKTGKAKADADFDGFENEMSLTIREIEVLGKSIHALMNRTGSTMRNGYLFRYGIGRRL